MSEAGSSGKTNSKGSKNYYPLANQRFCCRRKTFRPNTQISVAKHALLPAAAVTNPLRSAMERQSTVATGVAARADRSIHEGAEVLVLVQAAAAAGVPILPPSLSASQGGDGSAGTQSGDGAAFAIATRCACASATSACQHAP